MCNRYENVSNEVQFIDSVIAMDEWADEFKEWMSGRSNSMGYLGIAHSWFLKKNCVGRFKESSTFNVTRHGR